MTDSGGKRLANLRRRLIALITLASVLLWIAIVAGSILSYLRADFFTYPADAESKWIVGQTSGSLLIGLGFEHGGQPTTIEHQTAPPENVGAYIWMFIIGDRGSHGCELAGLGWTKLSDASPGERATWAITCPHWIAIAVTSLFPAIWLLTRWAQRGHAPEKPIGVTVAAPVEAFPIATGIPETINYARPGANWLPRSLRAWAITSFVVASLLLLTDGVIAAALGRRALDVHRAIASIPAQVAAMNAQNAANAAMRAKMIVDLKARFAAREARPPLRSLNDDEVARVASAVESQTQLKLTDAQIATLRAELQKSDQRLIDPSIPLTTDRLTRRDADSIQYPLQVMFCRPIDREGGVRIQVTRAQSLRREDQEGATFDINADGALKTPRRPTSAEIIAQAEARPTMSMPAFPPAGFVQKLHQQEVALTAYCIVAAADAALAGLLLMAGVMTFRAARRWTMLHRTYAWMQFGLVIIASAVWFWRYDFVPTDLTGLIASIVLVLTVVAAIYPAILILTLPPGTSRPHPSV